MKSTSSFIHKMSIVGYTDCILIMYNSASMWTEQQAYCNDVHDSQYIQYIQLFTPFYILLYWPHRFSIEDEPSNLDEMPLMMSEEGFENDESDYQTLPRARVNRRQRGLGWFLLGGWKVVCGRYFYIITLLLFICFHLRRNDLVTCA